MHLDRSMVQDFYYFNAIISFPGSKDNTQLKQINYVFINIIERSYSPVSMARLKNKRVILKSVVLTSTLKLIVRTTSGADNFLPRTTEN